MKCFGVDIEYKTRHFTVVILTMTIMIGLLALGFGLASARSISSPEQAASVDLDYIKARIENSTLFENQEDDAKDKTGSWWLLENVTVWRATFHPTRKIHTPDLSANGRRDSNITANQKRRDNLTVQRVTVVSSAWQPALEVTGQLQIQLGKTCIRKKTEDTHHWHRDEVPDCVSGAGGRDQGRDQEGGGGPRPHNRQLWWSYRWKWICPGWVLCSVVRPLQM